MIASPITFSAFAAASRNRLDHWEAQPEDDEEAEASGGTEGLLLSLAGDVTRETRAALLVAFDPDAAAPSSPASSRKASSGRGDTVSPSMVAGGTFKP